MIAITISEAVQCINNELGTKGEKIITITFYNSTNNIQIQGRIEEEERLKIKNLLMTLNDEKNFNNMEKSFPKATNLNTKKVDKKDADGANTTQQTPKKLKALVVNGNNEIQEKYSKMLEDMNISIVLLESKNGRTDIKNFEKIIDECDFCLVFVTYDLEPHDPEYYLRNNLIFEMGLLYGLMGKINTIYVDLAPEGIKLRNFIDYTQELICVSNDDDLTEKLTKLVEQHQS